MSFLVNVANAAGELTAKIFGKGENNSKPTEKAVKGQVALAQATKAAGAAAKGALANFDELNVLQKSGAGGGGSGGKVPKPHEPNKSELTEIPKGGEALLNFLETLKKAIEPLTETLFAGLKWGYENIFVPLSQWVGNELLPAFLEAVGKATGSLTTVLEVLKPAAIWLWESFLQPLGAWSGEMLIIALEGIGKAFQAVSLWIEDNKAKLDELWATIEPIVSSIGETVMGSFDGIKEYFSLWIGSFSEMLTGALDLWLGLICGDWELAWQGIQTIFDSAKGLLLGSLGILWETIKSGFGNALEAVKLLWKPIGGWFMENVMTPLQKSFGWLWDGIVLAARIAWQMVLGIWEPLSAWFMEKVVTPVLGFAKQMWEEIYGFFEDGVSHLKTTLKGYINFCLDMIEAAVGMFVKLFNGIIDALNRISVDIPDWVPEYGGNSFGVNIPHIPAVTIPRLATGAVIPPNAQFAAILGDQRSGRNLEAPEGLIREIVREESGAKEIVVRFEGSMAQLARVLVPAIEQENARQGTRLIFGGA
ncbi:MAG: hypothetical protein RR209_00985 [Angelakisella sp.]